jgi:hypothetical protein|tara:strand:- start:2736 stop:2930 length:195 start_codon:yes stop_codon:yes gene_type:complete
MNHHLEQTIWLITSELESLETLFKDSNINLSAVEEADIQHGLLKMKGSISNLEKKMKEDLDEEQ